MNAPIEDEVVGSLGLVLPEADCTSERESAFAARIRAAAQDITRALQR